MMGRGIGCVSAICSVTLSVTLTLLSVLAQIAVPNFFVPNSICFATRHPLEALRRRRQLVNRVIDGNF